MQIMLSEVIQVVDNIHVRANMELTHIDISDESYAQYRSLYRNEVENTVVLKMLK